MSRHFYALTIALSLVFVMQATAGRAATPPDAGGGAVTSATSPALPAAASGTAGARPNAAVSTEIIVTAQRRSERLSRTPVAITAVSAKALQRSVVTTESDLQAVAPGLTVKTGGTGNQLNYSLRGQTVDAFSSSRPSVLPYIDEIQVDGTGATAFYDLDSVQILKGPQGTLFGRNSTGGAVLFTTAKPVDRTTGYVTLRAGDYGLFQTEGAVNAPVIADKVFLRVAGFEERRDGFQTNLFDGRHFGNVDRQGFRVSLTVKPTQDLTNNLVVDYADIEGNSTTGVVYTGRPASAGPAFVPSNQFYEPSVDAILGPGAWASFLAAHPGVNPAGLNAEIAAQNARGPFKVNVDAPNFYGAHNLLVSDITSYDLTGDIQIKNIIGLVHQNERSSAEYDGTVYPIDDTGPYGVSHLLTQFTEELQVLGKAFDQQLKYVVGGYFADESDHERSTSDIFNFAPIIPTSIQTNDGTTHDKTYAGYGQGTYDLSRLTGISGLGFTAGVRFSSEQIRFTRKADDTYVVHPLAAYGPQSDTFNQVSWQFGLQEQLNPNLLLYIVTRRSNRSGGFNFFAPPLSGFGNQGGGEYKPESATDVEGGAKYSGVIGIPVHANLAIYNMWIDNIQRSNYVSIFGNLAGITVNVPAAEVTGVEFDGSINPLPWLTIGGNVNYTDARFTNDLVSVLGNPAVAFSTYPDTPKWSGLAYADVTYQISDRLVGTLHGDLYGQQGTFFSSTAATLNPGAKLPGYTLANFRVGIEDDKTGLSIAGVLKNAFNKVYYTGGIGFSSLLGVNTAVPGDPRTWLIEAKWKF